MSIFSIYKDIVGEKLKEFDNTLYNYTFFSLEE